MLKTARSYLHSSGQNKKTRRTDRRTDLPWILQRSALRAMRTRCEKKRATAECMRPEGHRRSGPQRDLLRQLTNAAEHIGQLGRLANCQSRTHNGGPQTDNDGHHRRHDVHPLSSRCRSIATTIVGIISHAAWMQQLRPTFCPSATVIQCHIYE